MLVIRLILWNTPSNFWNMSSFSWFRALSFSCCVVSLSSDFAGGKLFPDGNVVGTCDSCCTRPGVEGIRRTEMKAPPLDDSTDGYDEGYELRHVATVTSPYKEPFERSMMCKFEVTCFKDWGINLTSWYIMYLSEIVGIISLKIPENILKSQVEKLL